MPLSKVQSIFLTLRKAWSSWQSIRTVLFERVSTWTIFQSQLSSNNLSTHPPLPLQKWLLLGGQTPHCSRASWRRAAIYSKSSALAVKAMETTILKSELPGVEQTAIPSFTWKSKATYAVKEDKVSSFHIKICGSFRNRGNHTLSIVSLLLPYNDKTSFSLKCNDCELSQAL